MPPHRCHGETWPQTPVLEGAMYLRVEWCLKPCVGVRGFQAPRKFNSQARAGRQANSLATFGIFATDAVRSRSRKSSLNAPSKRPQACLTATFAQLCCVRDVRSEEFTPSAFPRSKRNLLAAAPAKHEPSPGVSASSETFCEIAAYRF